MTDEKKVSELTDEELAAYAGNGVAAKNRELLDELKKHKTSSATLQAELDAVKAELMDIKVNRPVNAMLAQMFDLPSDIALSCAEKFVKFELDGDNIVVRDREGQPMKIKPSEKEGEREAKFDVSDLRYILGQTGELDSVLIMSRASGTGGPSARATLTTSSSDANYANQLGIK